LRPPVCYPTRYTPPFEGIDTFQGESFHTSRWPKEAVDFKGKRVAVIGTGATAVQLIPEIAKEVGHLTVFQRTPNYCAPCRNSLVSPETQREWSAPDVRATPSASRAARRRPPTANTTYTASAMAMKFINGSCLNRFAIISIWDCHTALYGGVVLKDAGEQISFEAGVLFNSDQAIENDSCEFNITDSSLDECPRS
jgi:hypothetical protein